ncbi:MAG: outer membrane beta-barrel protein [Polyangiaceae bacterium]|nr:outer membrane beta-barrel protein [Polyangiaceae bacterium]
MSRSLPFATVVLLAIAIPNVSWAQTQPWLEDRRYTEGPGIQVGDFELHPGVAAEFGYDSNYFYRSNDEDPIGTLRLRITPSFSVSTLGLQRREPGTPPPWVQFRAGIHATYDEFFPVSGSEAGQDEMRDQRNVGGRADFQVDFAPGRVVFGNVHGGVTRAIEASNTGQQAESFNRVIPDGGAEIGFAPGGGLFDWRFGYNFTGTFFESSAFTNLNNFNHEFTTRGRWRFLPRSALTFDGRFSIIDYPDPVDKTDSHPMRARLGYNGLITNSFALLVMGGWGASFYTPTPQEDFDSFIGQAEVKWLITPSPAMDPQAASLSLSSLAAGFFRDFADSYIGTYEEIDRGYVKFSYMFAGRFLLVVDGGVAAVIHPDIPDLLPDGNTAVRVDASVFGEYRFFDFFGVNATVRYDTNITDAVLTDGEELQWQRFQAYLGARLMW